MMISAETAEDLQELGNFLRELNTNASWRQRVVLTPFFVVAGPDFKAMRRTGCPLLPSCEYRELFWHNSSGGLSRSPFSRGDLRELYLSLFREGLWHPEFHGRSHFDSRAWVAYLREGDDHAHYYFDRGMTFYHYGQVAST